MSSTPHKTPALEGLRGLALLLVLASHAGAPVFGGHLIMLTLSGYLLTSQLLKERDRTGRVRLGAFYSRRVMRLLPALVAMLIGVNILVALVMPDASSALQRDSLYALAGLSNWAQIGHGSLLLPHLWTLAVQMQVMIVWPIAMLLLSRVSRRTLLWVCIGGAISVWTIRACLVLSGVPLGVVYVVAYARIDGVLLGSALAVAFSMPVSRQWAVWGQTHRALMGVIGASVCAILSVCLCVYAMRMSETYLIGMILVNLCTVVLIALCLHVQTFASRALSCPVLVHLGTISYGTYLWHWPLVVLLKMTHIEHAGLIGAVCGLALGALSYRLIEAPTRGRNQNGLRD